jgi:hypothetical protein
MFCLNTAVLLKVKDSYMLWLAKVAIISLSVRKIKRKIYRSQTYQFDII